MYFQHFDSQTIIPFPRSPCCTVLLPILRLIDLRKILETEPTPFSDIVQHNGGGPESYTLTPERCQCNKWGGCRSFQAEPPWKVSITRGEFGMFLKSVDPRLDVLFWA